MNTVFEVPLPAAFSLFEEEEIIDWISLKEPNWTIWASRLGARSFSTLARKGAEHPAWAAHQAAAAWRGRMRLAEEEVRSAQETKENEVKPLKEAYEQAQKNAEVKSIHADTACYWYN